MQEDNVITNKGFEAKWYSTGPHIAIECIAHSSAKAPEVFIKKSKPYRGAVHPKQKSFSKLPF